MWIEFAMKKADIASEISEKMGIDPREASERVEHILGSIKEILQAGEPVKIPLFGNFAVRQKRARSGRNPRTGQAVEITSRRVVTFHASRAFKACVDPSISPSAAQEEGETDGD